MMVMEVVVVLVIAMFMSMVTSNRMKAIMVKMMVIRQWYLLISG